MAIGRTAAVGALLLCGTAGTLAAAGEPRAPVRLRAASIEISRLGAVSHELMRRETDALVSGAGLALDWRRAGPASETRPEEVRVVFLESPGRGAHADRAVLGATGHRGPVPTIWVYTPTVVRAMALPGNVRLDSPVAQRALGIALGRVVAHELVHLLAPQVPHGHGVMADRFRLVALDQARPTLPPACTEALAAGVRAWQSRGDTPGGSARGPSPSAALGPADAAAAAAP